MLLIAQKSRHNAVLKGVTLYSIKTAIPNNASLIIWCT